jgi:hypothetical protein
MAMGTILMVSMGFARILKQSVSLQQSAAERAASQAAALANDFHSVLIPENNRMRAQHLVEKFLTADGWKEKSRLVRDPYRVGPLMKEFYGQHGGGGTTGWKSISTSGLGYYEGSEMNQAITHVSVVDGRGEKTVFTVEHGKDQDCIEWESSIAATGTDWDSILKSGHVTRQTIAVLAAKDDYYNFGYSDLTHELCIRLQDPKTNELLSYGYLVRGTADFDRAISALQNATPEHPQPLLLEVQTDTNTAKNRQLRVTRVVNAGWRNTEGLASNQ